MRRTNINSDLGANMKLNLKFSFLILLALLFASTKSLATDKLPVFVSIVPQKYFVDQIGKDLVDVQVMVEPGASPATYEPKARQMVALAKSKLYFAVGVPFENVWLKRIAGANKHMRVVHTDEGIQKIAMAAHHHPEEEGGHHDARGHEDHRDAHHEKDGLDEDHYENIGLDPHIWLSPSLVKIQGATVLKALQELDPAHSSLYDENYKVFVESIDKLDAELKQFFSDKKGTQFMVFHPSWGYFAQEYGLKQVPIEVEGKDPKPAQLRELIEHAREDGIKVIFVQPQFSTKSAKLVAREIGGQVAFANPLALDWMDNLHEVAGKFEDALK